MGRLAVVMFSFLAAVAGFSGSARAELRAVADRPGIFEIGDPIMIGRASLEHEMRMNANLASYVENYGWPDYAEIQEVQVDYPFAPYEVRLYYLRRNSYLAYGRVIVAPSIFDYGIRKYEGDIRPETLDRLLTVAVTPDDEPAVVEVHAQPATVYAVEEEVPVAVVEAEVVEPEMVEGEVVAAAPAPAAEAPIEVAAAAPATDQSLEQIIQRLEAAAERAAAAADVAEQASIAANSSADRATTALERAVAQAEAR